jgi:hypothetical protein
VRLLATDRGVGEVRDMDEAVVGASPVESLIVAFCALPPDRNSE